MKRMLALLGLLALLLTGCSLEPPEPPVTPAPSGDGLLVHFIDVGQADCALLQCDGEYLLIDGGNREDGQLVVSYLEQQGVEELSAVVCTHPHEDHVGGLPAVLAVYPTGAVYAPTRTYASKVFDDFMYYTDQQGLTVTIPEPGDKISLGSTELTVLGPVKDYPEPNNTSIVLKAQYGDTAFLFTGDMEAEAEADMLDHWGSAMDFHADLLKVGHHGSDTSSSAAFLSAADPDYGVISVGEGNSYGHPQAEVLDRLARMDILSFRTDELGHILAASDGKAVTVTWENQAAQPEAPAAEDTLYIGNKNSKKFHLPTCANLPAEQNRVEFSSCQEARDAGFTPCGNCIG